ncbi:MAG: Fpg/Nei family DNA glycosylase [Gaiellaceae bacterium]
MPEGDSLHRAARRLQTLVGETVSAESPNPRAAATGVAEQVDGRRLEAVEAVGKNLLLRFEGGVVLRSHLRMSGSWRVVPRDAPLYGKPWLVLRGSRSQAVLRGGSVLELNDRAVRRVGPDILAPELDIDVVAGRFRAAAGVREVGEALLDQRLVSGIGNLWRAEALWHARVSPWRRVGDLGQDELGRVLEEARRLMRPSVEIGREERSIYRAAGRPCPRCGTTIRSRGQGDDNRMAYWCPACQPGPLDRKSDARRAP